jgi:DNA-nicking Smr family endonuclease
MSKRDGPSEDERHLFRQTVGPVRRLRHDKVMHGALRAAPYPAQTRLDEQRVVRDLLSYEHDPAELETGEELVYARSGLQHSLLRRLKRGQFSVGAVLDLHGMTVAMAREALGAFLTDTRRAGIRCVRIIHGKGRGSRFGQPVLKQKLNLWLRQRDEVLAFCSTRPVDGGTGAVYVLLKRA